MVKSRLGLAQSRPPSSISRLIFGPSKMMTFVFPAIIFLIAHVLVPDCEAASASFRSPSPAQHSSKDWEGSSSSPAPSTSHHTTTTNNPPSHTIGSRGTGAGRDPKKHKTYMVEADELTMGPAYEQSVNPFLFHLEQGWRLKPAQHRYLKKKMFQQHQHLQQHHHHQGHKQTAPLDDLPVDPSRPHFIDSNEATDNGADENRAFGDEEKDLRELLSVLFSPDY